MSIHAPFTSTEVEGITAWQSNPEVHPLTCPNRAQHEGDGVLTASRDGLSCEECDYTQDHVPVPVTDGRYLFTHRASGDDA